MEKIQSKEELKLKLLRLITELDEDEIEEESEEARKLNLGTGKWGLKDYLPKVPRTWYEPDSSVFRRLLGIR